MAVRSREELLAKLDVVRNETVRGNNSRVRITDLLLDILDSVQVAANGVGVSGFTFDTYATKIAGGVATLLSLRFAFFSASGTADDFARLQSLSDELVGTGYTIAFQPGVYHVTTELHPHRHWPNILGNAGVRVITNQARIASAPTPAAVFHIATLSEAMTTTVGEAISGAKAISVASITAPSIDVGTIIEITGIDTLGTDIGVTAISARQGTGTVEDPYRYILSLDRPIPANVPSGNGIKTNLDCLEGWKWDGGGMTFSGVTCRYFSISRLRGGVIENVNYDDTDGVPSDLLSLDNCGYRNIVRNHRFRSLHGLVPITGGIILETNDQSLIENVAVDGGAATCCIALDSCVNCEVRDSTAFVVQVTCEQSPIAKANRVIGGAYVHATLTHSVNATGTRIFDTLFANFVLGATESDWDSNVALFANNVRTTLRKLVFNTRRIRTRAVWVQDVITEGLLIDDVDVSANRTTPEPLGDANANKFLHFGGTSVVTAKVTNSRIADCEPLETTSTNSTAIRFYDSVLDMSKIGSASLGAFRCSSTTTDIRLYNTPIRGYGGSFSAIAQIGAMTVVIEDSVTEGSWLLANGTCIGHKRGQSTATATNWNWITDW